MFVLKPFEFAHRTRVVCGRDAHRRLPEVLERLGARRPLLVTDPGVAEAGPLAAVTEALRGAAVDHAAYTRVRANPTVGCVDAALEMAKELKADAVVGIGGGSSIDVAKSVALLLAHPGPLVRHMGVTHFDPPPKPIIAIPTTVGTGSEVTRGAVITDPAAGEKLVLVSDDLFATYALLDPGFVATLPKAVIASTGMDSLTQAIEGYVSRAANPVTDALNFDAAGRIATYIRPAALGRDVDALAQLQVAALMQGIGFHNAGLGLVHAMANTVGAVYDTPHGLTNAILLPCVMRFNVPAQPERFCRLAAALGEPLANLGQRTAAERSVEAVAAINADLGIPAHLREIGVSEEAIPRLAATAATAIDAPTNPRAFTIGDIEALYRQAL